MKKSASYESQYLGFLHMHPIQKISCQLNSSLLSKIEIPLFQVVQLVNLGQVEKLPTRLFQLTTFNFRVVTAHYYFNRIGITHHLFPLFSCSLFPFPFLFFGLYTAPNFHLASFYHFDFFFYSCLNLSFP